MKTEKNYSTFKMWRAVSKWSLRRKEKNQNCLFNSDFLTLDKERILRMNMNSESPNINYEQSSIRV